MRAFAVRRFGELPSVQDLPVPAQDSPLLIRVKCAGVNPIDYKLLEQLTAKSTYPFVVGIDFAGVIERVTENHAACSVGERVFGIARTHGSYAQYTAVVRGAAGEAVAQIPDSVSDEEAAALPIPGITALGALELLHVQPNQRLVVMGAAGSAGGYVVQIARVRGAHVSATVRGVDDIDEARRLGADEVYDVTSGDVIDALRECHPDGVDAILDLVSGPDPIRRDVEILKKGGRLVSTLYAAEDGWFAQRSIAAYNISSKTNPFATPDGLKILVDMLAQQQITARIGHVAPLNEATSVLDQLSKGRLKGKAVIQMS